MTGVGSTLRDQKHDMGAGQTPVARAPQHRPSSATEPNRGRCRRTDNNDWDAFLYKIITLAATASLLALAACNRNTETAPAVDDATASADAMSADRAGSDASTSAPVAPSGAATSGNAASETMAPADSSMAAPTGAGVGPVTDDTRANAQTAAEDTNLHPKPPTN